MSGACATVEYLQEVSRKYPHESEFGAKAPPMPVCLAVLGLWQ
jgi:hypothetical protein